MLMSKEIFTGLPVAFGFGVMAWIATTLIAVDKRTEIMAVKVEENHSMLKPLWEDFIKRSAHYDSVEKPNTHANLEATQ